jgi:hypothetical protein
MPPVESNPGFGKLSREHRELALALQQRLNAGRTGSIPIEVARGMIRNAPEEVRVFFADAI